MEIIIYLLLLHWIADFVCQTDKMANNKSKNFGFLVLHTFVYSVVMCVGSLLILIPFQILLFGIGLFFLHGTIDFITSKINKRLWDLKKIHWFFVSIGFDQWLHAIQIIILYYYITERIF